MEKKKKKKEIQFVKLGSKESASLNVLPLRQLHDDRWENWWSISLLLENDTPNVC